MIQFSELSQRDDQALVVLSLIKSRVFKHNEAKNEGGGWMSVHIYENGREHGYHIEQTIRGEKETRAVSFSENRNSDNIVVYYGTILDFETNANVPNHVVWERAKYFPYAAYDEAADFIFNYLVYGKLTPFSS